MEDIAAIQFVPGMYKTLTPSAFVSATDSRPDTIELLLDGVSLQGPTTITASQAIKVYGVELNSLLTVAAGQVITIRLQTARL